MKVDPGCPSTSFLTPGQGRRSCIRIGTTKKLENFLIPQKGTLYNPSKRQSSAQAICHFLTPQQGKLRTVNHEVAYDKKFCFSDPSTRETCLQRPCNFRSCWTDLLSDPSAGEGMRKYLSNKEALCLQANGFLTPWLGNKDRSPAAISGISTHSRYFLIPRERKSNRNLSDQR